VPKKSKPTKRPRIGGRAQAPFYKSPPPKPKSVVRVDGRPQGPRAEKDFVHAKIISPAHFELREDGTIQSTAETQRRGENNSDVSLQRPPELILHDASHRLWLYHGNCLELLDAIYARHGDAGRFDAIFADPPYFLSNGGISCHAGKMVKVDKGDWDKSRGPELNHEFNTEWLRRCQRVLKPNGTIWVDAGCVEHRASSRQTRIHE
jgi:hypothetical protein